MKKALQRVLRALGVMAVCVSPLLVLLAWQLRGYRPGLEIPAQSIAPVAFSPKGDVLAAGSTDQGGFLWMKPIGPIRFFDTTTGNETRPPLTPCKNTKNPCSIARAVYSPDSKLLAVLHDYKLDDLELTIYDLATSASVGECLIPFRQDWNSQLNVTCHWAPDASFVVGCSNVYYLDRSVVVWDIAENKERFTLDKTRYPVISPDGKLLATIDDNPRDKYDQKLVLKLWNTADGELKQSIPLAGSAYPSVPSFSPDGKLLAVYTGAVSTEVFDIATSSRVFQNKGWLPQFLADGTLAAVMGMEVQLYEPGTWQVKQGYKFDLGRHWDNGDPIIPQPQAMPGRPLLAVFDYYPGRFGWLIPLGRVLQLNVLGTDHLTLIDAATDTRHSIASHELNLRSGAVWSPDGSKMAVSYLGGQVKILDLPPERSNFAPMCALALGVVLLVPLVRIQLRKRQPPASPEPADSTAN